MAKSFMCLAVLALALWGFSSFSTAAIIEHSFHVQNLSLNRLCKNQVIISVNDRFPGPTLKVREGDTLIIHVSNKSPYGLTIHWHGVLQLMNGWADGPEYVTQCPIRPGQSYTYNFNVTQQEGTLWWHAHSRWLRQTVYGALIIRPKASKSYPFPKPTEEFPIILGEWYNDNIIDVEQRAIDTGLAPALPDAFTINGQLGDLYPCSSNDTFRLKVVFGRTYLLRIINAALNNHLFFKIANHNFTVVAVDASYTNPYVTDVLTLSPGQTIDALFTANQFPRRYYMAANSLRIGPRAPFNNGTTTGIIDYLGSPPLSNCKPVRPVLPSYNDTATTDTFFASLTSLVTAPFWTPVPTLVDEHMFVTLNLGVVPCDLINRTCQSQIPGYRVVANMNNVSFHIPTRLSMLEAFSGNVSGIYTTDFPTTPPLVFNYTDDRIRHDLAFIVTTRSTKVKEVRFNATVEIVFQNTALLTTEMHPMHLHGFNFYVLARGYGNYNHALHRRTFNLVNPQLRNTVAVPMGGWAVIRFRANNPGVWFLHCHMDMHVMPLGLSSAIIVQNGPTPSSSLPPPPPDLPKCHFSSGP